MTIAVARASTHRSNVELSIALYSRLKGWVYRLGWHIWSYSTIFGVMALAALSLVVLYLHGTLYHSRQNKSLPKP